MLTNNKIKLIKSLDQKKARKESGCFVVEGEKMVKELLQSRFETVEVFAVQSYIDELPSALTKNVEISIVSEKDLERLTHLKTANKAIALAKIPDNEDDSAYPQNGISIALENIQDPGNMGTIVRTAAWFGIKDVFCTPETVDIYNPKVIQSTMGAIFKVNVHYCDLFELAKKARQNSITLYGTRLDGKNIYQSKLSGNAIIVMGNESKGMSSELSNEMDQNIKIPSYAPPAEEMESLNVSIATAIVCAEFKRQNN